MNKHLGSSFDDFLKEEGIFDELDAIVRETVGKYIQQIEWAEQQRQVKEQLKHQIDNMLVTDVDYGELTEDGASVVLTIKGQPRF